MILSNLELSNFRNYIDQSIHFDDDINIICGNNAQGKTNLLEAIYLLCIARSFRTSNEKETINFDNNEFCTIRGKFYLNNENVKAVVFYYHQHEGKQVSINRKRIGKLIDLIGQFPIVLSAPEEYSLTSGPPAERRRFIDILLSQISIRYIHALQDYYRIIKQRNKILSDRKFSTSQIKKILAPWDESLIEKGSFIIWERIVFSEKFNNLIKDVYSNLTIQNEVVDLKYKSKLIASGIEEIKELYRKELHLIQDSEFEQGVSLLGPHRDNFSFQINGKELRKFGSRGQHKSVLIVLTIAEFRLIKEQLHETPIILVDDLFSEIDKIREIKIMKMLQGLGQVFITTTIDITEVKKFSQNDNVKYYQVENGQLRIIE